MHGPLPHQLVVAARLARVEAETLIHPRVAHWSTTIEETPSGILSVTLRAYWGSAKFERRFSGFKSDNEE